MMFLRRDDDSFDSFDASEPFYRREDADYNGDDFVSPIVQVNAGLWTLWAAATVFLLLRVWCKVSRRNWLWYDDYILILSWLILMLNNSLISYEYATGYVASKWDDRMHILINISSCGTVIGQALTKTAFAVTLLRMTKPHQQYILWFCIVTMNAWMIVRCLFEWCKVCDKNNYQQWYRLDFCIYYAFRNDFKEGGNVYNVLMDFAFALFPWWITWKLEMRRIEKIGLCLTMSLGMIVAIVAAVRIAWKDDGNKHGTWYFWHLAQSNIWYSSEVAGTIIVQCIPVLRPLLRDVHTSLTSRKLGESTTGRSSNWRDSKYARGSGYGANHFGNVDRKDPTVDAIALNDIPEEASHPAPQMPTPAVTPSSPSPNYFDDDAIQQENMPPLKAPHDERHQSNFWPFPENAATESRESRTRSPQDWLDVEHEAADGLRPPPRRPAFPGPGMPAQ